jgi:ClpP class serine protease
MVDILNETAQAIINTANINATVGGVAAISSQQYVIALVNSANVLLPYLLIGVLLFGPRIVAFVQRGTLIGLMKTLKQMSGRNVIVMSHVDSGLFGQMIILSDLTKMERLIRKHKMKDIDFILNTPGGEVFASMRIAQLIKRYNGRVIVPKYAMSGGTMISMGAQEIIMDKNACMGPCDPQVGTLFKSFSDRGWNEIIKRKGYKKSHDDTIAMAMMSSQVTETIRGSLKDLLNIKNKKQKARTLDMLTKGETAHLQQFSIDDMHKMGFNVKELKTDIPHKIIEAFKEGGVIGI